MLLMMMIMITWHFFLVICLTKQKIYFIGIGTLIIIVQAHKQTLLQFTVINEM